MSEENTADTEIIFKNFSPFTDCISKINNTQIDNSKDIDVNVPIYNYVY